ncbi:MAG: hypothetical protein ABL994_11570, partial [Verrucomicrobiales bacterium]
MKPLSQHLIQVSATFTAEPLREGLAYWMNLLGVPAEIRFSDYGQVLQETLNPASASGTNPAGGFNLFLLRPA